MTDETSSERAMYHCLLCRRDNIPLDDTIAPTRRGTCICLACYIRQGHLELRLSPSLRRAIEAAMSH